MVTQKIMEVGDRVICIKSEINYNTLVKGKIYTITHRAIDPFSVWIYKLRSDDGITCNWIEQYVKRTCNYYDNDPDVIKEIKNCYFIPVTEHRERRLNEIGI
jgi:hypothetical protein